MIALHVDSITYLTRPRLLHKIGEHIRYMHVDAHHRLRKFIKCNFI